MLSFKEFLVEIEQLSDPRAKDDNKERLPKIQNKTGGPRSLTLPPASSTNIPTNPGTQWNPNYKELSPDFPPSSSKINSEGGKKRK